MTVPYINDPDAVVTAAWHGEYEILKSLLDKGASIETRDEHGNTPLIAATDQGFIGIVQFLVENGADVNAKDNDGDTALDIAIFKEYEEIANYLKAQGSIKKEGKSAKEEMWDSIYTAFDHADAVKRLVGEINKAKK
jgi:ankyrin repeat protein